MNILLLPKIDIFADSFETKKYGVSVFISLYMYLIFQQHKKKKLQETQKSMLKCLNYGSRCVVFKFTNSLFDLDNDKDMYILYMFGTYISVI